MPDWSIKPMLSACEIFTWLSTNDWEYGIDDNDNDPCCSTLFKTSNRESSLDRFEVINFFNSTVVLCNSGSSLFKLWHRLIVLQVFV